LLRPGANEIQGAASLRPYRQLNGFG
jgi:hypothetical protein